MENEDLIKEFMGWTFVPQSKNEEAHYERGQEWMSVDAVYYTSWDLLMTVVKKIKKHQDDPEQLFMETTGVRSKAYEPLVKLSITSPIGEVYNRVLDYVNWYNGCTAYHGRRN